MFDLTVIISDVIGSISKLQDDKLTVLSAGILTKEILQGTPFRRENLSEYVAALPEMWSVITDEGTFEEAAESAFKNTLYDQTIERVLIYIEERQPFKEALFTDVETVVTYLTKWEESFELFEDHRSECIGNPISVPLARLRTFSTRIRQADRDRNEFRLLANSLRELDTTLEKCGYDELWAEHFSNLDVLVTRVRLLEKQCSMIWHGKLPLPPSTLPSRFTVIQQPNLSARQIGLNKGSRFLSSFEATYGMEPIKFVSVRESLKVHYRLMNPSIMQVLYDHFGLSAQAWDDDFEVVSRDAKSSLRAQKRLQYDVIPKEELDPLVKHTFGKSQGLHNYLHVPSFTGPSKD